jgi:ABC-type transporter Mla subunit MlaD
MNVFGDVLLKLLPFTYKDGSGTHFGWGALDAADWIITAFILFLWFIFGIAIYKLWKSKRADEVMVSLLHDELFKRKGSIEDGYNDFVESLKKDDELSGLWNEYDESLIKTTNPLTNKTEIRNSIDAEYFFNKHTLLTHLGTKYYASIPSILLGIGLIGTFFGLFFGLVQLNMGGDAELLKESMAKLINAAGVKFAASIWGLGLSLAFTFYEKYSEGKLEQRIEKIQWLVNAAFKRQTAEQSLAVMEFESKQQTNELRNLSISLTDDSVNKLSDALGQKIKETLEIAIGEPIQQMTRNMGGTAEHTLYDTMKSFSGGLGDEFVSGMRNMLNEVLAEIRQTTGTDAAQLQTTLSTLTSTLSDLKQTFDEQNSKTKQATDYTLKALSDGLMKIGSSVAAQNEGLQASMATILGLVQTQADAHATHTGQLGDTTTQATTKISETVNTTLTGIRETLEDLTRSIHETFKGMQETIEQSKNQLLPVPDYLRQFASSTESLRTSAASADSGAQKLSQSVGGLDAANNVLKISMAGFAAALVAQQSHMGDVSEQLGQTVEHAGDITQSTQATYERLAQGYSELLEKNTQSIAGFTQQVQAYKKQADEGIAAYQSQTDANIKTTLGAFDAQLKDFATSLSGAIAELNATVEDLSEMMGRQKP